MSTPAIYISYRVADTQVEARLIYSYLVSRFGENAVFLDKKRINPGDTWPNELEQNASGARVILALIKDNMKWVGMLDDLSRRLQKADDWVRKELEIGLKRGVLMPVFIDGAAFPALDSIDTLKSLPTVQGYKITTDEKLDSCLQELAQILEALGITPNHTQAPVLIDEHPVPNDVTDPIEKHDTPFSQQSPQQEATTQPTTPTLKKAPIPYKTIALASAVIITLAFAYMLSRTNGSVSTLIGDMMPRKQELLSTDTLTGYTLVDVEGGAFTMGSSQGEKNRNDDECQHEVLVASFQMGKYEVTQKQWKSVMGSNPSKFNDCEECPVEGVSWNEVQQFISKLNERSPIKYRLPTEVEWEYAARGGVQSRGYLYAGGNEPDNVGWFYNNSGDKTHPAGSKLPNELGLHDMSGNVMEWCQDWKKPYPKCGGDDYTNTRYVIRGGSWSRLPRHCRVAYRFGGIPDYRYSNLGFRLARSR